jgi:hypothetical protein
VTLRLQLAIADPYGVVYTVTLPPIAIQPASKNFEGNYVGESFQVRHAGHSPALAYHFADLELSCVSRHGTARFGSWPEGIERYEAISAAPPADAPAPAVIPAP